MRKDHADRYHAAGTARCPKCGQRHRHWRRRPLPCVNGELARFAFECSNCGLSWVERAYRDETAPCGVRYVVEESDGTLPA